MKRITSRVVTELKQRIKVNFYIQTMPTLIVDPVTPHSPYMAQASSGSSCGRLRPLPSRSSLSPAGGTAQVAECRGLGRASLRLARKSRGPLGSSGPTLVPGFSLLSWGGLTWVPWCSRWCSTRSRTNRKWSRHLLQLNTCFLWVGEGGEGQDG